MVPKLGGHGKPLQRSCLENSMDRGAWRPTVHGVAKSRTRLSEQAHSTGYSSKEGSLGILRCFQLAAANAHNPGQWASTLTPRCLGFSIFKRHIACFSIDISFLPFTLTRASKISFNYFNPDWLWNRPLSQRTFNKLSLCLRKYKIWNVFHKVLHKIIFSYFRVISCSFMVYGSHAFIIISKFI